MAHFAQKSLATAAIILSFLAADLAFAATAKSMKTAQATEDPDLKLSIQELKEKYPPSLLKEKNKTYKSGQKINIDDYSVAEIKAAFLNADRNFQKSIAEKKVVRTNVGAFLVDKRVVVRDKLELVIIEDACSKLGTSGASNLNKNQQVLQRFIFSNYFIRNYVKPFISDEANHCFEINDPLITEDRN